MMDKSQNGTENDSSILLNEQHLMRIKDLVQVELARKQNEMKGYFHEQNQMIQKQLAQLDEEREHSKKWTQEAYD